ncbi:hypothetical protein [Bradyrhizobium sp.]|uniref:hypothetical protein n=1 Tax=Bradyrhizobium sp. TaxID=376 RepID=UPI002C42B6FF|nr:hypothetical protein [Bradyrhizobium sp.]HMM92201.1 hypothetical protein [Bradyrhizobium sp.]
MARFAYGDQPDLDPDLPNNEVASPPVAPASPPLAPSDETPQANEPAPRPIGSSFSDLGATFNGVVRPTVDVSSPNVVDQTTPVASSIAHQTNDLAMVQNNLMAEVNAGQFSGARLGHVQAILSDLTSAISAANATSSAAGLSGGAAAAQETIRASQLSIINAVTTDLVLASPAPDTPPPEPAGDAKPHNLTEIGALFDDVTSQILGGVNDDNRAQISDDINAVISDIQALMAADPKLFDGLTGEHADKIVQQLQLELVYINDADISPTAAQASNDNIHDIIELIQGDAKLADLAPHDGSAPATPNTLAPDPIHLDTAVETTLVANFIAQSNALGKQAVDLVGSNDAKAIAALIDDLKAFEKGVTDLGADQGGTLGVEIAAMIKGLQTGNANLVTAAADQMHGNAVDIGGSSVPAGGGTYNTDGVTVAEVLGTPVAEATPAAAAASEPVEIVVADLAAPAIADHEHSPAPELSHLHHLWG